MEAQDIDIAAGQPGRCSGCREIEAESEDGRHRERSARWNVGGVTPSIQPKEDRRGDDVVSSAVPVARHEPEARMVREPTAGRGFPSQMEALLCLLDPRGTSDRRLQIVVGQHAGARVGEVEPSDHAELDDRCCDGPAVLPPRLMRRPRRLRCAAPGTRAVLDIRNRVHRLTPPVELPPVAARQECVTERLLAACGAEFFPFNVTSIRRGMRAKRDVAAPGVAVSHVTRSAPALHGSEPRSTWRPTSLVAAGRSGGLSRVLPTISREPSFGPRTARLTNDAARWSPVVSRWSSLKVRAGRQGTDRGRTGSGIRQQFARPHDGEQGGQLVVR